MILWNAESAKARDLESPSIRVIVGTSFGNDPIVVIDPLRIP